MDDETARFCWKLADLARRLDWWNIRDEFTEYEWALLLARYLVEPFGDDREDQRAAINTAGTILSQVSPKPSNEEVQKMICRLQNYLPVNQPDRQITSPRQARKLLGG